jgi:ribosomal protein L21E
MTHLEQGDQVRIDIPDVHDPDFDRYHGRLGTVIKTLSDDADEITGDDRDNVIYRVEFEGGKHQDFRWRDLRPITE